MPSRRIVESFRNFHLSGPKLLVRYSKVTKLYRASLNGQFENEFPDCIFVRIIRASHEISEKNKVTIKSI